MFSSIPKTTLAAAATLLTLAGSANAAFFCFASDTADHAWSFTGNGGALNNATTATDPIVLMIDDNNGTQTPLQISTQFTAQAALTFAGDVPLGGGTFSHNYLASGSFSFRDIASGTLLLTVNFEGALFTARGNANSWFTTGALQGDFNGASVTYTWSGASLPLYNLNPGTSPGDLAFGLSVLNSSGAIPYNGQAPGANLGADHLPNAQWWSEASYTGTTFIPAPGTLALLGLSGLAAARRRR
jgi:uncharacterized protein (TIGR03382 family)